MCSDNRSPDAFVPRSVENDVLDESAHIEPAARRQRGLMPEAAATEKLAPALADNTVVWTRTARAMIPPVQREALTTAENLAWVPKHRKNPRVGMPCSGTRFG